MKLKYTNLDYTLINCNLKSGTFITISAQDAALRLKNTANIKSIRVTDCSSKYPIVGIPNFATILFDIKYIASYGVVDEIMSETKRFTDKLLALDLVNQLLNSQISSIIDKLSKGKILFLTPELIELEVLSSDIILGDILTIPDKESKYTITNWKGVNKVLIDRISSGTCSNSDFSITTSIRTDGGNSGLEEGPSSGSGGFGEFTKTYYGVIFNNEPLYESMAPKDVYDLVNNYLSEHLNSIRTNGLTFTGGFSVTVLIEKDSYKENSIMYSDIDLNTFDWNTVRPKFELINFDENTTGVLEIVNPKGDATNRLELLPNYTLGLSHYTGALDNEFVNGDEDWCIEVIHSFIFDYLDSDHDGTLEIMGNLANCIKFWLKVPEEPKEPKEPEPSDPEPEGPANND